MPRQRPFAQRFPLAILVADDVPVNRKLALLMLKALGYSAKTASNGREALEAVQRERYDVVLMDVQMPGMDGFAATQAIRASLGEARPWIVGMSAHSMGSGEREHCLAAGMDDFLPKPFSRGALAEAIGRVGRSHAVRAPFGDGQPGAPSPPAGVDDGHCIDRARLASLQPFDTDGSMVREAIAAFERDAPGYLAAMVDALGAGDRARLASAAHALCGAAGNVGARHLAAACRDVEILAAAPPDAQAARAVSECLRHLDEAVRALRA